MSPTRDTQRTILTVIAVTLLACTSSEALACPLPNSSFPANGIYLVGSNGPTVDAFGQFSVTLRDINNNPFPPPAAVSIDFGSCTDIRLAPQTFGSMTVSGCVVTALVNQLGVATFRIRGGAVNAGNSPGADFECAVISAVIGTYDCFLNNVTVAAFDQTGNLNGVNGGDLSVLLSDLFVGAPVGRSDFNFSDSVTAGDLSTWLSVFFANGSVQNGGVFAGCP